MTPRHLATIEASEAGQQHVLPGAERATQAIMAKRRAAAPLAPKKPQVACDVGLFSDDRNQQELF